MADHEQRLAETTSIEPGDPVFDRDGRIVGRVDSLTDDGFEVTVAGDPDGDEREEIPGQEFGEGQLMWRCGECGEMGEIDDGVPESCPNCGASREAITEVRED